MRFYGTSVIYGLLGITAAFSRGVEANTVLQEANKVSQDELKCVMKSSTPFLEDSSVALGKIFKNPDDIFKQGLNVRMMTLDTEHGQVICSKNGQTSGASVSADAQIDSVETPSNSPAQIPTGSVKDKAKPEQSKASAKLDFTDLKQIPPFPVDVCNSSVFTALARAHKWAVNKNIGRRDAKYSTAFLQMQEGEVLFVGSSMDPGKYVRITKEIMMLMK